MIIRARLFRILFGFGFSLFSYLLSKLQNSDYCFVKSD